MVEFENVQVEEGDLIIAASDGLWDNARDDEMMASIRFAGHEVSQV
jgi:serine/threonine protein phosphatase PrpC